MTVSAGNETLHRRYRVRTLGKDLLGKRPVAYAQMVGEDPFQGGAQIGRRVKIPTLIEPVLRQPRPLGYDAAAGYRAAKKERNGSRSVVRAVRAIDASRAAEFRDCQDNGVLPRLTKAFLQFVKGAVESRKPRRELALRSALIGVGVVAVDAIAAMRGPSGWPGAERLPEAAWRTPAVCPVPPFAFLILSVISSSRARRSVSIPDLRALSEHADSIEDLI